MDFFAMVLPALTSSWWLIALAVLLLLFKTPWAKGVFGEWLVRLSARLRLDKNEYHAFHNVMLATPDGTTQIDHIFISRYGVFVVETKNMKGWIFGTPEQRMWTQQIYRRRYKFQNPLRQNYKHIKALEALLDIPEELIHSVIVFVGDSRFKTPVPENVTYGGEFIRYIKTKTQAALTTAQIQTIVEKLTSDKLKSTFRAQREHVHRLESRKDIGSEQFCPKCGEPMILRIAKRGTNKGNSFWGCSQYPKCRAIRSVG